MPKSQSAAKSPKMTTPVFIRSVTFNITISFIALELQIFRGAQNVQNGHVREVIEQFKTSNFIFYKEWLKTVGST